MFSWLNKLFGNKSTSATSSTEDATTTTFHKCQEKAESVDSSDKNKLKQEDGTNTNERHDYIDFCNDKPQESSEEWDNSYIDNSRYALELKSILERVCFGKNDPIGVTIALTGALGAGKSSIINRVRDELSTLVKCPEQYCITPMILHKEDIEEYALEIIGIYKAESKNIGKLTFRQNNIELRCSYFKCYWFQGEDGLALSFISHMVSEVGLVSDEARKLIIEISALLIKFLFPGSEKAVDLLKNQIVKDFSINEKIKRLDDILQQSKDKSRDKRRFLVILDDLDRMEKNEILAILRIIKTFGCLRNVVFLLVYDNDIVSSVANSHFPEAKGKYLDKFIQYRVNILPARRQDIVDQIKYSLIDSCNISSEHILSQGLFNEQFYCSLRYLLDHPQPSNEDDTNNMLSRSKCLVDNLIVSKILTPRDVLVISQAVIHSWVYCEKLICLKDLLVLEIFKKYKPDLHKEIYSQADRFQFLRLSKSKIDIDELKIPYVCEWQYNFTPLSFSLKNQSLMFLYLFGIDSIQSVCKNDFPKLFDKVFGDIGEIINYDTDEFLRLLIADLSDLLYSKVDSEIIFKESVVEQFDVYIFLDNLLVLMLAKVADKDRLRTFLLNLFSKIVSKNLHDFSKGVINTKWEQYSEFFFSQFKHWVARLMLDNEANNYLFENSKVIEQWSSSEDKDIQQFYFLARLYAQKNELNASPFRKIPYNQYVANYTVICDCYFSLLKEQIDSGELFDSRTVAGYFFDFNILVSNIFCYKGLDKNDFDQIFHSLKASLQKRFREKKVGYKFIGCLIDYLNNHKLKFEASVIKELKNEEELTKLNSRFFDEFVDRYELNPDDVLALISDHIYYLKSAKYVSEYEKTNIEVEEKICAYLQQCCERCGSSLDLYTP